MKKLLCVLLICVLCLSVAACGGGGINTDEVAESLNGTAWLKTVSEDGVDAAGSWSFTEVVDVGPRVVAAIKIGDDVYDLAEDSAMCMGDYKVEEGFISISWDDPECPMATEIYYTYEEGNLSLYLDEEKTNVLTRISGATQ